MVEIFYRSLLISSQSSASGCSVALRVGYQEKILLNDIAVPKNIESVVRGENQSERQRTQGRARREYDVKVQSQWIQHVQIEETVEQSHEKSTPEIEECQRGRCPQEFYGSDRQVEKTSFDFQGGAGRVSLRRIVCIFGSVCMPVTYWLMLGILQCI